jgi:MFS superfamily sulfate permease-like transporter
LLQTVVTLLGSLNQIHWLTLALSLVTLAVLVLLPRLVPRVPAALVAVAGGILASALFNLGGVGVKLVGRVPPGLPALSLPDLSLLGQLWPGALGIALMSFVESIAAGRAFARHGDPPPRANQELLALGAANVGGSFFQAYPAGGGTSQTAVNAQSGAQTQVAQAVTAGISVLVLLFLAPLLGLMPQATLGALVLVAAVGLIKVGDFRAIARVRKVEFGWAIVTFVGVLLLGTLAGILVAVIISMLVLIYASNHPQVYVIGRKPGTDVFRPLDEHPRDETFDGLLMLRPVGLLYFTSIPNAIERMWAHVRETGPRVLALDCRAVPNIEYTALKALAEFEEQLREEGITLWLTALNPYAFEVVERALLGQALGHERMFFNLEQAVEAYQAMEAQDRDSRS